MRQGLAANRVTLGLALSGQIRAPAHARISRCRCANRKVLLKQLQFDLEAHPPQAAIVGVEVRLNPVEPRVLQHGLFIPQAPAPEKLQLTLARLTALLGEGNVGSPHLLDTHRPDAFVMRAFSAGVPRRISKRRKPRRRPRSPFAITVPPIAAQVRVRMRTSGFRQLAGCQRQHPIAAGPWRASGDWWTDAPWNREEWDIELSNGGLYRVYQAI